MAQLHLVRRIGAMLLLLLFAAPVSAAHWPGLAYSEVRGYAYTSSDPFAPLVIDGRLRREVSKKAQVRLSAQQVEQLLDARRHASNRAIAECWDPHHAFVFYDMRGKAVAWVEVCFKCGTTKESPRYLPGFNMRRLRKLCDKLKLPNVPEST